MIIEIAHFQEPVARAKRAFECRDAAGMFAVDRKHQAVKEAPPFGGCADEQPVHRWCHPDHAQMIAKGGGGCDRLAIDAAATGRGLPFAARWLDAGAQRCEPERALGFRRHRPGAVALVVGDILKRGAPQPAAWR